MWVPLGPGGINLPAIIMAMVAAAAAVATQGYAAAAATSPSVTAAAPSARMLSPLKLLHLNFIYGVATDAKTPRIWLEVCQAPTKSAALTVLSQYIWAGREVFRWYFFGYVYMLHVC